MGAPPTTQCTHINALYRGVIRKIALLRAYLTVGAQICGPPALDAEFGAIDFLTLLDLAALANGFFSRVTQPPETPAR